MTGKKAEQTTYAVGNPSPLGLLGFAIGATILGIFDMGLLEKEGKEILAQYGFYAAGLGQIFTGVVHLLGGKANTFAYVVFSFYGMVWVTIASIWDKSFEGTYQGASAYPDCEALFMSSVGLVSVVFTIVASRHNKALFLAVLFVSVACPFLAIGQYNHGMKKIGGISLALAGLTAFYMCAAELINEEFKEEILPGLKKPFACFQPNRKKSMEAQYDYNELV